MSLEQEAQRRRRDKRGRGDPYPQREIPAQSCYLHRCIRFTAHPVVAILAGYAGQELQCLRRAFEAKRGERKTQRAIRFLKYFMSRREAIREAFSHAGILRTLAGKHPSDSRLMPVLGCNRGGLGSFAAVIVLCALT